MPSSEIIQSPAFYPLRPGSRRLLAYITAMVEHDGGTETTLWHDQLADVVGSKSIVSPGIRELVALGLITHTKLVKRSTFTMSEGWRKVATKREALIISVNARLPVTHRKWKTPQPASTSAQA